ncbi:hypothetical protein CK203_093292 [Vitis vinifera]|uniref:Uncharacterized protein n=1 Tax=Vitis vinifera TaxID=29760 RepID=A0A438E2W6_VITVI|nr:hypothetical protein CK203_093292 [Vitis vinifera]
MTTTPIFRCCHRGFKDGMNIINLLVKDGIAMNSRKLLGHDLSDYDYAAANPRHDPCKKGKSKRF